MENFEQMNIKEKIEAIEKVIQKHILPMLAFDGGSLQILDIREENSQTHVFIRYQGACASCSSAAGATLFAIEETLRRELKSDNIRVFPI